MTDYDEHTLKISIMIFDNWYLRLWLAVTF